MATRVGWVSSWWFTSVEDKSEPSLHQNNAQETMVMGLALVIVAAPYR
jgi:hypothetical protein